MNNPNTKYETILPGEFAGIVRSIEKMESKLEAATQKKTVLDLCEVESVYIDDEYETVDCYYGFADVPKNGQTDETENLLVFEHFERNGNKIKLDDWQQQTAAETILYRLAKRSVY